MESAATALEGEGEGGGGGGAGNTLSEIYQNAKKLQLRSRDAGASGVLERQRWQFGVRSVCIHQKRPHPNPIPLPLSPLQVPPRSLETVSSLLRFAFILISHAY